MSKIPTKKIDGDVTILRHVTAGGNTTIEGSVNINHNIKIKGWLDAPNVATPLKGLFSSEARLKAAYTDLREGWYALVNDGGGQAAVWMVEDGAWKNTGEIVSIEAKIDDVSFADFMDETNKAIDAEAEERYQVDSSLNAAILQEVKDRKAANTELSAALTAETTARENKDLELQVSIANEASARTAADSQLDSKIAAETTARKAADTALDEVKEKRRKVYNFALVDALTTASTHEQIQAAFKTHFNCSHIISGGGGADIVDGEPIKKDEIIFGSTGTDSGAEASGFVADSFYIEDKVSIPGAGDRLVDVWNKAIIYLDDQQQRAVFTCVHQYDAGGAIAGKIAKYDITYSDGIVSKTITLNAQNADAWTIEKVDVLDTRNELKTAKTELRGEIKEEADKRAYEDEALNAQISIEASERVAADSQLDSKIAAEATARNEGDNELASRIADEMRDRIAADNTKKGKDFVVNMTNDKITTSEGYEFNLVDVDWQALANVILGDDKPDIVLSDGINNEYRLDHVWLADGMPYGYKLLNDNRKLNIATVVGSDDQMHVVYKFNEGAVTYDNLGGVKPLVIGLKLGDDGQPIVDEEMTDEANDTFAMVADVTFEQVKAAYDAKRPIYMDFSKWADVGDVMLNLVPTQQIFSMGVDILLQGMSLVSNADNGLFVVGFYAVNYEGTQKVLLLLSAESAIGYDYLKNKPQINGVELVGNKTSKDLKLQGALTTSADLTLSSDDVLSLTDMAKKRLFIDLWNQAAGDYGRYNEDTGYFELYEIYDIGWDEALLIYRISGQWDLYSFGFYINTYKVGYGRNVRVLLPFVVGENGESIFTADSRFHNDTLQYLAFCRQNVSGFYLFLNVQTHGFRFPQLKKIYDEPLRIQSVASSPFTFDMPKLEYAKFWFTSSNYTTIYFRANLDYECSNYLFTQIPTQNANKQCVFKLAANMFKRLSGTATDYDISGGTKAEWMAIADLAASKNITLTTE